MSTGRIEIADPSPAPGQVAGDGLADADGPIPAFGPARTDERGRIVMSDEEWEARRVAAIRALGVIGDIADETDTDAVWDDVFRGLAGGR